MSRVSSTNGHLRLICTPFESGTICSIDPSTVPRLQHLVGIPHGLGICSGARAEDVSLSLTDDSRNVGLNVDWSPAPIPYPLPTTATSGIRHVNAKQLQATVHSSVVAGRRCSEALELFNPMNSQYLLYLFSPLSHASISGARGSPTWYGSTWVLEL